MQNHKSFWVLAPLFMVIVIDGMGMALVMPILSPLFMLHGSGILPASAPAGLREFLYGITMASFTFCMFFGAPLLGDLSDMLGRKKVIFGCLTVTALALILSGVGIIFNSILLLIIGRCIAGFAAGSQPIAQAAIADISSHENKAANMSLLVFAACMGFVVGPMIGGYFSQWQGLPWNGFATPFFIATLLAFINALSVAFTFQETYTPKPDKKLELVRGLLFFVEAFKDKSIRILTIALLFMQMSFSIYFTYVSVFIVQEYHYSSIRIGHYMAYMGTLWTLTFLWVVRIAVKRWRLDTLASTNLFLLSVAMAAMLFNREWLMWVSLIPLAIGNGLSYTALLTLMSNAVDQHSQGWIMGVTAAVMAFAWTVGSVLAGVLGNISALTPFIFATVAALTAGVVYLLSKKHKSESVSL